MPTKQQKTESLKDLQQALSGAKMAIVADYRGLSVSEITDLRRRIQKAGGELTVAKNTLVKVAIKDQATWQDLNGLLQGPTALVIGHDDFLGTAKALYDFSKEKRAVTVQIRGGVLEGEALDAAKVQALATMPSREVLLTQVAQLFASPITGFARVLDALAKQKEGPKAESTEEAAA